MTQLTLEPHARSSDPVTSHDAAASISADKLRKSQAAVLKVARCHDGGFTLEGLVGTYNSLRDGDGLFGKAHNLPRQSDSGIRTRLKELVRLGKVRDTGNRATLASGRKAIIWEAIP